MFKPACSIFQSEAIGPPVALSVFSPLFRLFFPAHDCLPGLLLSWLISVLVLSSRFELVPCAVVFILGLSLLLNFLSQC